MPVLNVLMLNHCDFSHYRCLNRDHPGQILLHLCVSMLFMNASFLAGGSRRAHIEVCAAVAVLVHYFLLTSLAWMCVEATNMYQLLVHVFATSESHFMLKRAILAWGKRTYFYFILVNFKFYFLEMTYPFFYIWQLCFDLSEIPTKQLVRNIHSSVILFTKSIFCIFVKMEFLWSVFLFSLSYVIDFRNFVDKCIFMMKIQNFNLFTIYLSNGLNFFKIFIPCDRDVRKVNLKKKPLNEKIMIVISSLQK